MERVPCPNAWAGACRAGRRIIRCLSCGGSGARPDGGGDCPTCGGAGEEDYGLCPVCLGDGDVTLAQARLVEAYQQLGRVDRNWSGDDAERPGVTRYSLAMWARRREQLRHLVWGARGRPALGNPRFTHVVELIDAEGRRLVSFHGFNWGYGGEGADGLAVIMADCGFFESLAVAYAWASDLPAGDAWYYGSRQVDRRD